MSNGYTRFSTFCWFKAGWPGIDVMIRNFLRCSPIFLAKELAFF
jgi:hypothetical protein